MNFNELQAKVARAEDNLEAREREVAADLRVFGLAWREAWSPPRVIAAGLAAGFLAGWARPARAIGGVEPARWLQLAGSLAGLAGSVHAAFTATDAKHAAEDAADNADVAADAATGVAPAPVARPPDRQAAASPGERRHVPDPTWDRQPLPAEAATELSERR